MSSLAQQKGSPTGETPVRRWRAIIDLHFDPHDGTPYWLEQRERLDFDPRKEIHRLQDLTRFPVMDQDALADRPLDDFIPRVLLQDRSRLITVQTGGTSGRSVWSAYTDDEFQRAFVEPFIAAAQHVGFPRGGRWLYVGPSGPHVIARAADAIARQSGAMAPFTIDFDARWAKKLPPDSFAAKRYLAHLIEQATCIIEEQGITHLFTTPAILTELARKMTDAQRHRIQAVHYGGMAIRSEEMTTFQTKLFPSAMHLSGYGNTLFGCCLELDVSKGRQLCYYPHGDRLIFGIIPDGEQAFSEYNNTNSAANQAQKKTNAHSIIYDKSGASGRLVFSRFDESMLLINFAERDRAILIDPPAGAPLCFHCRGVQTPEPMPQDRLRSHPSVGLY